MMVEIPRMKATLEGSSAAGLPIWVGFSLGPEEGCEADEIGDPIELREGGLLRDAVSIASDYEAVDAMVIMHSDVRVAERGIRGLQAAWNGPVGVWAHAARMVDGAIVHDGAISPAEYAAHVPAWRDAGATMIGGCCGIGPSHIAELAPLLAADS
jgi:homocysteine S-methyltransferase